ncbi:MAG: TolC family protein [Planctomycetes bacterium]|nr:TolC family protein [Planctomycetota bacterium]
MNRPHGRGPQWLLLWLAVLIGCQPRHPFYLRHDEDLATYIDSATMLAYPDLEHPSLDETAFNQAPLTLRHPEFQVFWDLTLQEAVQTALHNSKVIRSTGSVRFGGLARSPAVPDALIANPQGVATVYDPAIFESDPNLGVEAALAAFDAQFASSLFWNTTDRPQNRLSRAPGVGEDFVFFPTTLTRTAATYTAEVSKRSATGTQFFFRNITEYDRSNTGGGFQALNSFYTTQFETEFRHPVLRGNGARVNRVPVLIARIRTDVSLAEFEANVRNLVQDVENAYWDLHCAYRNLQTAKVARDSALGSWRIAYNKLQAGTEPLQVEAQARQQYFTFRAQTETALNDLYNSETALRWLMGLATTDGRLIRPIDEPTTARVAFDWPVVSAEALVRSPELRRIKWFVKQRELELIAARNLLLPELNIVGLYRWYGAGDHLVNSDRNGLNFPTPGSTAFDVLTEGDFQESRIGFDFAFPVGFRQEYAGVRNAQLSLAREHARLEDAELNVSSLLAQAIRNMEAQYYLAQSFFSARLAAAEEVESVTQLYERGLTTLDLVLRAQQRLAESEISFYRALCEYNKGIAFVHFRKGSLLEYNNVMLAEGPWPEKAYFDAEGHARRRAASYYLDYGWTQPPPVSSGPAPQGLSGAHEPPPLFEMLPGAVEPIPAEPVPTPPPAPPIPPQPEIPELGPPLPPPDLARAGWPQHRSVLRASGHGADHRAAPSAASYSGFGHAATPAIGYRGLQSSSSPAYDVVPAAAFMAPPAPFSTRREAAPATYHAPFADGPLHRLPPAR